MSYDGNMAGNTPSLWNTGYTPLPGHRAYLPAATMYVWSDSLTQFPFLGNDNDWFAWVVRGEGYRWGCDDAPHDYLYTTLHQIWVNTGNTKYAFPFIIFRFN
jgi:hypothetical protein